MDGIRSKFLDLIKKQNKIPSMAYADLAIQREYSPEVTDDKHDESYKPSDQEILENLEEIYFTENNDIALHILKETTKQNITCDNVKHTMLALKQYHTIISKKVLQHILAQRSAFNEEILKISEAERELEEAVWICKKARSYLGYAKRQLTTTTLEIFANYRKREILRELLKSLNTIKALKSADTEMRNLLSDGNYSRAISILLENKTTASEFSEYKCIQSLSQKLQETLVLIENEIDTALSEMPQNFDPKKYAQIQAAYKLLNKSVMAMDQLHINFISAIHSTMSNILKTYSKEASDEKQKQLFEQLCQNITTDCYIPCLINLCKSVWTILASHYQISMWHQNSKLFLHEDSECIDENICEKLNSSKFRIWNDIQSKLCTFLSSTKLKTLKYEQFIQVLSIVQRLKRVGLEFCGENAQQLMQTMRLQSEEFFDRYHTSCLEEIYLFLDNESWVPVDSFKHIMQLQEFRSVKHSLQKQKFVSTEVKGAVFPLDSNAQINSNDETTSIHSQDGSSMYGSCSYFLRFSEKSSPFDGGLDATMFEEDVLSGLVDEASYYFSEDTDDEELKVSYACNFAESSSDGQTHLVANNSSLNVLRCIGKYLQMCKLLHCITPKIIASSLELVAFYCYAVHEIFGKDSVVSTESIYDEKLQKQLENVSTHIIPRINNWTLNFSSLVSHDLCNPDILFGLSHRIIGVESGICLVKQLEKLKGYFSHLLADSDREILQNIQEHFEFAVNISKPVYMCVASKVIDLQAVLVDITKMKWDINHVSVQHSKYIDTMNRSVQTFAMLLEEISKTTPIPLDTIWNSLSHISTHLLVEGYSNAKKCSAGGRALMQLDFTHFMSFMELISGLKFNIHRNYVDTFIKAYYYPADLFEEWIRIQKDKKEYSTKQLTNLIICVCVNDKRKKQKLLRLLENNNESA